MTNWQKRLIIGFNIAALFIFLDVSLLIFIRSVDGHGVYQTLGMKWITFSVWVLCYASLWMFQGITYMFIKIVKVAKKHQNTR
ncbi:Protein of unknown function [Streptococcus equinus]|uniref:DUF3923 family protein n=1 Tax=Streptococcus equinus TaxID=1335 RepID=A0A1H0LP55_STREI|nr:DUF3923 family protein [Streptococcus equinus]SDO70039.1 Protein of unknown function [Streptococcus equinus]